MVAFITKYWLAILLIIAILLFVLWFTRRKNISFDFNMAGNFSSILSNLTGRYAKSGTEKGIGVYFDVPLTTIIKNDNAAAIVLKNIIGFISYNGEAIMQTRAESTILQDVQVPGKTSKSVTDAVQVLINPSSIKFFTELVKGKKPQVLYNFNTTIFGKPQSFTNRTQINK